MTNNLAVFNPNVSYQITCFKLDISVNDYDADNADDDYKPEFVRLTTIYCCLFGPKVF